MQNQSRSFERKRTMQNLLNLPAYNAVKSKMQNENLSEGFKQALLNALNALERSSVFIDSLEKAQRVRYLSGNFIGPFVVNANNGNIALETSSSNCAVKVKSPSKYDLFNQCLSLGLVTMKDWNACSASKITKQMLKNKLASNGKLKPYVLRILETDYYFI